MNKWMKSSVLVLTLAGLFPLRAVQTPVPNIITILVDDLGWQDVNCYYEAVHGTSSVYETPTLDALANRGIRFTQAYAPSPTCSPSRAAYLSGKYGVKNGVYHVKGNRIPRAWDDRPEITPFYSARLPLGSVIIPQVLKRAGYQTAHVGKWHVCGENKVPTPLQLGFDFSFNKDGVYNDPSVADSTDPRIKNLDGIFAQPRPGRLDAFDDVDLFPLLEDDRPYDSLTDVSVRWLEKVGRENKPFFLNFCPKLVHGPIMTRDKKRLAHYCEKLGIEFPKDPGSIADPDAPGQNNPYYAAMVDSVDWMVAQVLETLEGIDDPRNPGHKLVDNTYLIITSDNGGAQRLATWKGLDGKKLFEKVTENAPLREGKSWSYEGGIRIPFIVTGPGIEAGQVNAQTPVHLIDLFPTFLAMAGLEASAALDLDGCNILPLLTESATDARHADGSTRESLFFHHPADNKSFSSIRKGPWKLMLNTGPHLTEAPAVQLFKLYNEDGSPNDIGESRNLVEQHPEIARQLQAELEAWMETHHARTPYLNPYGTPAHPGREQVPDITGRGTDKTTIWATFETGGGKAQVKEAFMLYSLNGGAELKYRAPRLEEWFQAPATLRDGRVEAVAPPGMTHAVFCLVDENNFLQTSEPVEPVGSKCRIDGPISTYLEDGYAYRPGLLAMIKLGHTARTKVMGKNGDATGLTQALKDARAVEKTAVEEKSYAEAIRELRTAIRALEGVVPEADHPDLHRLVLGRNW